jgi:hypothetical protein
MQRPSDGKDSMRKLSRTLLASLIGAGLLVAVPSASADMPSGMEIGLGPAKFPGSDGMKCTSHYMDGHRDSRVCWDGDNDRFWVKDDERDGYSAVASWSIPAESPAFSTSGYCRNKEKAHHWAFCQVENGGGGQIVFGAGVYDGNGENKWPSRFQGWTRDAL